MSGHSSQNRPVHRGPIEVKKDSIRVCLAFSLKHRCHPDYLVVGSAVCLAYVAAEVIPLPVTKTHHCFLKMSRMSAGSKSGFSPSYPLGLQTI